jgi:Tol biopolymer transport system component
MFSIRVLILGGLSLCAAASASLASDRIVFLRIAPTESTLYIANADGSDEQPLTQPGSMNYNPAWSARGDWIAFTSDRAGSADLFRVHPDGTGLERLTDDPAFDDQAAFSPDGKRIVFVSTRAAGRANLWTLDIATRRITRLTSGDGGDFRPAWSPDGQWIAFSSDRGSELPSAKGRWERLQLVDLYVIHPDGTGLRRVSQHGNFCGSPKWLSDGKHLIADCMSAEETWDYRVRFYPGQQSQIFKVDIASGSTTALTTGPDVKLAPSVLPSGEIAYVLAGKSAKTIVYAGGKAGPTGADLARNPPAWSPDAKRIVYCRQKFNRTPEPQQLWSRDPKFSLYTTTFLPAYDFKGEHLAVTKTDADGTSLYLIEDGKPAQAIMQRKDLILAPQWSPDGKQIVVGVGGFTSFLDFAAGGMKPVDPVNGGAEVGILNADGTGFHVLTSGANNNAFASFSPNGKQIVYRTAGPEGQGLRIMNLEDRSITVLTDEYDNFPVWSSRNLIGFIRRMGNDFEVMTVSPDGKNLKQLTDVRGNEAHLAWSPDGERIVFTSSRMGFKDESLYTSGPQPYGEIFVMRYDGSAVEQLTDDQWEEGGPAWQRSRPGSASTGSSLPERESTTVARPPN